MVVEWCRGTVRLGVLKTGLGLGILRVVIAAHPAFTHPHSLLPLAELGRAFFAGDAWLEDRPAGTVDIAQLGEVAPHAYGQTSGDCGAEGGGFAHFGAVDGNGDEVCLGLGRGEELVLAL